MNNPQALFPNVVVTGAGSIDQIPYWIDHFEGKRVLLITDPNIKRIGLADRIINTASKQNIELKVWDGVIVNPDLATVKKGLDIIAEYRCDFIIGLGGGSVLDTAKAVSVIANNGGNIDASIGLYRVKKRGLPKILIPTTSGTGSEATQACVLVDEKTHKKVALYSEHAMADVVIMDYELTYNLPPRVTADTGSDALAHAVEACVSAGSTEFSDIAGLFAIKKAGKYLVRAYTNGGNDKEARKGMADAAFYAGLSFCTAGLGAAHGLAYPLIEYNVSHGRSVSVFLPWVMEYNLPYAYEKYSKIACSIDESCSYLSIKESAVKSIDIIKQILTDLDISFRLRDYGVKEENLHFMAQSAVSSTARLLKSNPAPVSIKEAEEIYSRAY